MSLLYGYADRILHIDLCRSKITSSNFPNEIAAAYIGGTGLDTKILFDDGPSVDALSPENVMIIATGPLTGTIAPCSCRIDITAKSPLTGIFGT